MTILDQFFILFKTNAAEVKTQTTEARKAVDEFEKTINASDKTTRSLATSLLEVGVTALASYASFEGIKSGIKDALAFNLELDKQEKLTGEAGHTLAVYDATFQNFGSNRGEFLSWFSEWSAYVQKTGGNVKEIIPNLRGMADQIHALPDDEARQFFQQIAQAYGLPQSFYLSLRQGSAGIDEFLSKNDQLITANEKSQKIARDFEQSWEGAAKGIEGAWTDLENVVLPFRTKLLNFLNTPLKIPDWLAAFIPDFFLTPISQGSSAARSGPLGVRSNNPGNIQPGGREAVYGTPQEGADAELAQLRRYGQEGRNTVGQIGAHWPDRAHADSWTAAVASRSGFDVNQPLNMNDPATLARLANGVNTAEGDSAFGNINSSGKVVNIDTINIHTQATDADGIAGAIDDKLNQHFRTTIGNYDDAVAR